jgi:hypothetical protein
VQSLNLMKFLPPINPNVDIYNCGVVQYAIPSQTFDKQFVTRVDYTLSAKNNLYGRYLLDGYQLPSFFSPTNILFTTQSGNPLQRVQTFTLGEEYTINSGTVNSAHVTILRRVNNRGYNANDINAAVPLGVNVYQAVTNGLQLNTSKFTIGGGTNSVSHFNDNTLAFDDDVTMVRGKHQIVFGGEYVRNQLNISNAYETNGTFSFGTAFSSYGPTGTQGSLPKQIGDGSLDFLQGTMSAFQQSKQEQNALRAPIPSLYVQDTFHTTKQLTIVAGLRWSPEFMPVDAFNRGTTFSLSAFLANQVSTIYPNAPAGTMVYGDPGVSRSFTQSSPLQFDPNVGLSFDLFGTGKTVVRAGAEFIYDEPNFFTAQRVTYNPPFATVISQASGGYIPFSTPWAVPAALKTSATITSSPFPLPIVPTPGTAQFFTNSQFITMPAKFHPTDTMQWTASIQQAFPHGWQLQFDYIGNKSSHDELGLPLSPVVYIPGNWNGAGSCTAPGIGTIAGTGTGPCSTTSSSNYISRSVLVLENPTQGKNYSVGGGGSVLISDEGMANYNGLVTTIQHRLSSSFSLLANWTWSKCLDIEDNQGDVASTTVQNPNNPAGDYGPCGFDYRHIENVVLVVKSQFAFSNRMEKAALDGWEFAPLIHIQSGAPFTVTVGADNSETDVNNDRVSLIPGVPIYQKVAFRQQTGAANREYLNPAAFATSNAFGTYGNTGRNEFRAPPALQMDAQVSRIFPVYETLAMTLRLEAYNMLNHPNFGTPTTSRSSGTFGQIGGTNLSSARVFQGAVKFTF